MSQHGTVVATKRKKNPSLSNQNVLAQSIVQLHQVIKSLQGLSSVHEEDTPNTLDPQTLQQPEEITATMQLKLTRSPSLDFNSLTAESLELIGIESESTRLILKNIDIHNRAATSAAKGANELWTSEVLHRHVNMLNGFVAKNEAGARMWIDAFFYRVKAMLQDPDESMVLSLHQCVDAVVSSSVGLCGYVDYAVIKAPKAVAESFLDFPKLGLKKNKENLALFVTEANKHEVVLEEYLPQAAGAMFACSKALDWVFIICKNNDETSGRYWYSRRVSLSFDPKGEISKEQCDVVAGILVHWVEHSNQDLEDDDWFTYKE
ncbi:hypothetical protein D9756_008769 [Leucocoprinus leucothites]|uniref:Uncharacterized protein n=1 Tax=Leucocoprinus leucothites TaxID=201217 RepID=A0A8H5CYV5_9AGAR|nr:hypothetical protein D9756_008769 [Leucoagaricus leucothites]